MLQVLLLDHQLINIKQKWGVIWICGNQVDGLLILIHMVGFNGIVDFTWEDEHLMMKDRLTDG